MKSEAWLVTGSNGYLGRHLIGAFERLGIAYIGIDRLTSQNEFGNRQSNLLVGDFTDSFFVSDLLRKNKVAGVIHLAALKDVSESLRDPRRYDLENATGTATFFKNCVDEGVSKIIFASSAAVYGNQNTKMGFHELDRLQISSPYGASKISGEQSLMNLLSRDQDAFVALRFFNLAGVAQNQLSDLGGPNFIPKLIASHLEGSPFLVYGDSYPTPDGSALRDYIHVSDAVNAIIQSMKYTTSNRGFEIFNIGTGIPTSVFEAIDLAKTELDVSPRIRIVDPRQGDAFSSFAQIQKAKKLLSWRPLFDFASILRSYRPET